VASRAPEALCLPPRAGGLATSPGSPPSEASRSGCHQVKVLLVLGAGIIGLGLASPDLHIRHVPRTVDPQFHQRTRLCAEQAPSNAGPQPNDQRVTVQTFLGPALREIHLHQLGDSLAPFPTARATLRALLAARPRAFSPFPHWAEATPLRAWGLLGTVHYVGHSSRRIEVAGRHLCVADSLGVLWWIRLEAVDVFPEGE